jgi:hypothetical protein
LFHVAAHEQSAGTGIESFEFGCEIEAAHAGHNDIGKKQIDGP